MNSDTQLTYLVGVFGYLQLAMMDVGLINEKGIPPKKRKKLMPSEQDALAIYDWVSDQISQFSSAELRARAKRMDNAVKKLLNDHKIVNNFLLGLLLLRHLVDDGRKDWQILMGSKINRLVDVVDGAISDEEFSAEIKRTTSRTADNLYRQFTGKAQLSDEVRDAKFKKILGGKRND